MKCPSCESDYGVHYSMRFCPHCGFEMQRWKADSKAEPTMPTTSADGVCKKGIDVVKVLVDPSMPDDEAIFRDEKSGSEVKVTNIGKEPDYYTKAEIDERLGEVLKQPETIIGAIEFLGSHQKKGVIFASPKGGWRGVIEDLRRRFLG